MSKQRHKPTKRINIKQPVTSEESIPHDFEGRKLSSSFSGVGLDPGAEFSVGGEKGEKNDGGDMSPFFSRLDFGGKGRFPQGENKVCRRIFQG